jgi:hypothetical protein
MRRSSTMVSDLAEDLTLGNLGKKLISLSGHSGPMTPVAETHHVIKSCGNPFWGLRIPGRPLPMFVLCIAQAAAFCWRFCDCFVDWEWGMVVKQEVKKNDVAAKKRWVAPEVTRLEFPKTAGTHKNTGGDLSVSYVALS